MIILVTGDTGFIGRHLIDKLKTEHEVHGYDYNENHKPCIDGYDWVIHLGAISDTTERDVDKIMLQNYEFSKWIFKECNSKGVNFQYASSASVYDHMKSLEKMILNNLRALMLGASIYLIDGYCSKNITYVYRV